MKQEERDLIRKGKQLSFLLRHDTEYKFDEHGYREVSDLLQNHDFTKEMLEEIVKNISYYNAKTYFKLPVE